VKAPLDRSTGDHADYHADADHMYERLGRVHATAMLTTLTPGIHARHWRHAHRVGLSVHPEPDRNSSRRSSFSRAGGDYCRLAQLSSLRRSTKTEQTKETARARGVGRLARVCDDGIVEAEHRHDGSYGKQLRVLLCDRGKAQCVWHLSSPPVRRPVKQHRNIIESSTDSAEEYANTRKLSHKIVRYLKLLRQRGQIAAKKADLPGRSPIGYVIAPSSLPNARQQADDRATQRWQGQHSPVSQVCLEGVSIRTRRPSLGSTEHRDRGSWPTSGARAEQKAPIWRCLSEWAAQWDLPHSVQPKVAVRPAMTGIPLEQEQSIGMRATARVGTDVSICEPPSRVSAMTAAVVVDPVTASARCAKAIR
jgi:hypothetical protein